MCGNGVPIGMAITQVHHRITHKVQIQAPDAFFAVVAGTTTATTVGLPIATGTIRTSGATSTAFVWFFRRTDVSPYPPNSAIAEFENENSHCIKLIKQKRQ
jgi:hypothetical protein